MDRQFSERQLIRWAVPGWITLFFVILLTSTHLWFDEGLRMYVQCFITHVPSGTIAAAGGAAIALGFALGFVLFQVYFMLYWTDRKFWKLPRVSTIVGGVVNYKEVVDSLDNFKPMLIEEFGHWPVEANKGGTERQRMEASVVAAWWRGINKEKRRMVWENRNQYLVAVYHSLGAMLVGAYVTLVLTVTLYLVRWATLSLLWLPLIVNLVILAGWFCVLFRGRKNTEFSHRTLTKHALYYFCQRDLKKSNRK